MKIGKQGGAPVKLRRSISTKQKVATVIRIVVLAILLITFIWAQNNFVVTQKYIYTDIRVPKTFTGYKIAHVSDLHNEALNAVSAIKKSNPDLIVVTGGLADSDGECSKAAKVLNKLSNIAPTVYVYGETDADSKVELESELNDEVIMLEGDSIDIPAPDIDESAFIDKYIGSKIMSEANKGNEEASLYIEYTKQKLAEDKDAIIRVSGISYGENQLGLIDKVYSIIGTDKEVFQVLLSGQLSAFETLKNIDLDIVFSGESHGIKGKIPNYTKGMYNESGTTLFCSGGIGNTDGESSRVLNYPEIIVITLSDGTIKNENPLERFLGMLMPDIGTRFDDDGGFQEYSYQYYNGRETN